MVEGTPLLRAQAGNRLEGSNPFGSAIFIITNSFYGIIHKVVLSTNIHTIIT